MMIVVGIVMILAVIAIPNMMRSKMNSNDSAAAIALKVAVNALNLYAMNNYDYPTLITALGSPTSNPAYLNDNLIAAFGCATQACLKDGFTFTYTRVGVAANPGFTITAQPYRPRVSGTKNYYADQTGVIKYCTNPCTASASQSVL